MTKSIKKQTSFDCRRASTRYNYEIEILLQSRNYDVNYNNEKTYYTIATMRNYSREGMCFEKDYALQPGSEIHLKFTDCSDFPDEQDIAEVHRAEVIWCRKIEGVDGKRYETGVRYSNPESGPVFGFGSR